MYPTVSHFINDIFNVNIPLPIQMFGLWVAVAFIIASWLLTIELKRKENEKLLHATTKNILVGEGMTIYEFFTSLLWGFLLGFKLIEAIFNYSDLVSNPQHFILSSRGSLSGGVLLSVVFLYLKWREKEKSKLDKPKIVEKIIHPYEIVGNMTMIAAISGIIGAKIFHNLENIDEFLLDPIGQLISFSGLTFYGGLIFGALSVIFYAKKYKINTLHLIDAAAPSLIIAYGIGRIGCQLSGDGDWGIENLSPKPEYLSFLPDWMWSYNFPHNVINAGELMKNCGESFWYPYCYQLTNPVWPTAFYETLMCSFIFLILWKLKNHIKLPGALFCIYLIFNGVERFLIEKIRVNTEYNILGGITQAEIISIILIFSGIAGVLLLRNKPNLVN